MYKDGTASEWAICDKNQYLTTPIRLKYFPSLSPSVLRGLLSTPSMRVPTPDISGMAADLAASAFNLEVEGAKFNGTESSEDRKLVVEANRGDELDHLPDNSRPFIPSRKARVLTLDQSSCNRTDPEASAGLISTPENHRAVSPILIDSACRSMLDVRSPFPHNTLPNAYMRPKARSVKSNLHALAHQKSAANIALQHRVHEDLSCGVLRDFQRVIGELQGTSYEVHDTLDSAPSQVQSLIAAGPSLLDAFASMPETDSDGDGNCSTRQLDASPHQRVPETQLTDSEDTPDASQVRHASACPLHMEFAALLLNQAAAEESHARELVALADRLKRMAKLRRHLADVSTEGTV
ncbi:hypothetical protein A0H81_03559 [Grifola frondosa]|uniref:Uncharacterized protein n=1 Tax=Grifola frondosa TaxID=5627 RepID=A0A1C7MI15_GRIFR|nr:hypothetical protein A0H81_03559 [Grifola frondosa]